MIGTCISKIKILAVKVDARGTGSGSGHRTLPIVSCIESTDTKANVKFEPAAAQGTFSSSTSMAGFWLNIFLNSHAAERRTFYDRRFVSRQYTKPFPDLNNTAKQSTGHGCTRALALENVRYGDSDRRGDVPLGRFQFICKTSGSDCEYIWRTYQASRPKSGLCTTVLAALRRLLRVRQDSLPTSPRLGRRSFWRGGIQTGLRKDEAVCRCHRSDHYSIAPRTHSLDERNTLHYVNRHT